MKEAADVTPKDEFLNSLNRCAVNDAFISAFYDRFLNSSDEVSYKFRFTEFEKQNEMLLKSLKISAAASSGEPAALREVAARSRIHDCDHLDVKPSYMICGWMRSPVRLVNSTATGMNQSKTRGEPSSVLWANT